MRAAHRVCFARDKSVRHMLKRSAQSAMHNPQVVRSLLSAGAPWNALDRRGRCAGDLALEAGHAAAAEAILEAGATLRGFRHSHHIGLLCNIAVERSRGSCVHADAAQSDVSGFCTMR